MATKEKLRIQMTQYMEAIKDHKSDPMRSERAKSETQMDGYSHKNITPLFAKSRRTHGQKFLDIY